MTPSGPLSGIRIVEVGHMLAGPYCGLLLADLGADVVKVEPPDGDIARHVSPHFIGPHNAYFASLNRNKRSVVLDLGSREGQAGLAHLVRDAHALITNLRPSAIKKLGLTYDALREINPKLVCVALTGYGLDGPFSERPAYDYVIQATSGVMAITGEPDAPPTKTGYSAVDNSAGMLAAIGLLAKIVEGNGGQVDVAMYDTMLSQLNYLAGASLNAGETPVRRANSSHPYIVPAQIFPTADGWLTLFITHDLFWAKFCLELGQREWLTDPRFATMKARRENRVVVIDAITQVLRSATAKEWTRRLSKFGVVAAEVQGLEDALGDPVTADRRMVVQLGDGTLPLRAIGNPIRCSGFETEYRMPPTLGEHGAELLKAV